MRRLILALCAPLICFQLAADTTGRLQGMVRTKDKKPIPSAKVLIKRIEIAWSKELSVKEDGSFIQAGLEPKQFIIEVNAEGFVPYREQLKINLGEATVRDIVLKTQEEAAQEAKAKAIAADPGAAKTQEGVDAFNSAVDLVNKKNYADALPAVEKAYKSIKDGIPEMKDESAKAEMEETLKKVEKVYGVVLFENKKFAEAQPYLVKAFEKNPKDAYTIQALALTSKELGKADDHKKYQALLDGLMGPRPEIAYNKGVEAFNANKMKEAKEAMLEAIQIDPKYANAYYRLAYIEVNLNSLKAAKGHFEKYLELAPTGQYAGEAKMMIGELKKMGVK